MEVSRYLDRITLKDALRVDHELLEALHYRHVLNVPFENLDVYCNRLFDLKIDNIFQKVISKGRGGFCYELNLLFNELLIELGFKSRIIEARIFTDNGDLGPRYDHMAVLVDLDKKYLADVGFGDLFLKPLEITEGVQSDGRNNFKIEVIEEYRYLLLMSKDGHAFEKKYVFDIRSVKAEDFYEICLEKQTSRDSYFVKNLVCTLPNVEGRITIFNNSLIERRGEERLISKITDDTHLRGILISRFKLKL